MGKARSNLASIGASTPLQRKHCHRGQSKLLQRAAAQDWEQQPRTGNSTANARLAGGISPGTGEKAQGDGSEAQGGGWQADGDEYYDGSDWGVPEPVTDWGEGPAWQPNPYNSWGNQGYDFSYGAPGQPPPPPPPQPYTAAAQGGTARNYGEYSGARGANGSFASDPLAAEPGYVNEDYEPDRSRRASGGQASSSSGSRQPLSDITLLTREEMEILMPVPPTRSQTKFYQPKSIQERLVQIASSIGVSLALSKSAILAAPVLLYPIWSPWVKAGCKNLEVYTKQLRCLGLWRAQVLEVQVLGGSPFTAGSWAFGGRSNQAMAPTVRVLIGDGWPSGARVQLEFPYTFRSELLAPGEPVEALVLARDATFSAFKVIREVYAPGLGLWLSDYPFIDKSAFLDVSLQIENERQANAEAVDVETVAVEAQRQDPSNKEQVS